MSDCGSNTDWLGDPGSTVAALGQMAARACAEPPCWGVRSTGKPRARRAADVAGPTEAVRVSAGMGGDTARRAALSNTALTALTDVNPTQLYSPAARAR